ncbi:RagB/SusD family nutrient uptake outer membrane protein [Hymenobacter perfusus]|uniref:RagB/SusD family nutrient uptake outer membrane protein n=1 Tax=Hymenobacter perfusus TaxID=1236770 RepID=A0A3R9V325_9BACT|nr:RagB/SusD family nutrient uptake outer membrane protein [Hymenobacter perfusus]RSK45690.1 RagB/SusD family nutrient uptake outer membrane protein [Hymenobacter perfusus]
MKKITLHAALVALLLGGGILASCEKQLELEPEQQIPAETALSDQPSVETAVTGAYSRLFAGGLYGNNLILVPDLLAGSGYLSWQGTFQSFREMATAQITTVNADVLRTWQEGYRLINISNLVLDGVSRITFTNNTRRTEIEGEMQLMRGLMYFELVRLYGQPNISSPQGIPISLNPVTTVAESSVRLPRASVREVYNQIIADMEAAIQKLPEEADAGRFDTYDATALLARVRLQLGEYAAARTLANEVISNSGASLNASVLTAFTTKGSPESLLEVLQNDQNNSNNGNDGLSTFYSGKSVGYQGRADIAVVAAFAGQYEATDLRGRQAAIGEGLIYLGDAVRPNILRSFKWNSQGQNIPVIRLAEMYLIRAEANQRLGTTIGATPLEDVNELRQRAGATPLAQVTLDDVLKERELELAYEGFRIHDYRRTGRNVGTQPSTIPARVLPIPQYEINLGNSLPQNEGYN